MRHLCGAIIGKKRCPMLPYAAYGQAEWLRGNKLLTYKGNNLLTYTILNKDKPLDKVNELFSVYLFQLISKFCNQNIIVLPIKKIIVMLWKVLLVTKTKNRWYMHITIKNVTHLMKFTQANTWGYWRRFSSQESAQVEI